MGRQTLSVPACGAKNINFVCTVELMHRSKAYKTDCALVSAPVYSVAHLLA